MSKKTGKSVKVVSRLRKVVKKFKVDTGIGNKELKKKIAKLYDGTVEPKNLILVSKGKELGDDQQTTLKDLARGEGPIVINCGVQHRG